jgi:hypothetical protein
MPKTVRGRDYRTVFANGVRFRVGDNDAAMTFLIETDDETGTVVHEDQVQVIVTPKTLKVLHMVMTHGISELERLMGPIDLGAEKISEIEKSLVDGTKKK